MPGPRRPTHVVACQTTRHWIRSLGHWAALDNPQSQYCPGVSAADPVGVRRTRSRVHRAASDGDPCERRDGGLRDRRPGRRSSRPPRSRGARPWWSRRRGRRPVRWPRAPPPGRGAAPPVPAADRARARAGQPGGQPRERRGQRPGSGAERPRGASWSGATPVGRVAPTALAGHSRAAIPRWGTRAWPDVPPVAGDPCRARDRISRRRRTSRTRPWTGTRGPGWPRRAASPRRRADRAGG